MPEVQRIAKRVHHLFTHHIDIEELEQAGYVGLVSASNTYHPVHGAFPPYAYWRIRGEMIDSQKRRAFREAGYVSLQVIAEAYDGWLPPALDTDPAPLQDAQAEREQIHRILAAAIAELPDPERRVMRSHLEGDSLGATARQMGRSLTWTRAKLAEAREAVRVAIVGDS
jgi:RNA polymerase sigma factor (sigma-70 family)